jgi:hypothetical protein
MSKHSACDSCGETVLSGQGLLITTIGIEEDNLYCNNCLKQAMHRLSMKPNKKPDEINLLKNIRRFMKYKAN